MAAGLSRKQITSRIYKIGTIKLLPGKRTYREMKADIRSILPSGSLRLKIALDLLYRKTGGNKWLPHNYVNHFINRAHVIVEMLREYARTMPPAESVDKFTEELMSVPIEQAIRISPIYQQPTRVPINKQAAMIVGRESRTS